MKILPKIPKIEVIEQKPNTYTNAKKYVVVINGERQLSGHTKEEALMNSLNFIYRYKKQYELDLPTVKKALWAANEALKLLEEIEDDWEGL